MVYPPPKWPILCLVGRYTLLAQSLWTSLTVTTARCSLTSNLQLSDTLGGNPATPGDRRVQRQDAVVSWRMETWLRLIDWRPSETQVWAARRAARSVTWCLPLGSIIELIAYEINTRPFCILMVDRRLCVVLREMKRSYVGDSDVILSTAVTAHHVGGIVSNSI